MRRIYGCVAAVLCLGWTGCNAAPDYNLVPVTGTVTIDGAPLANKGLMFTPESGKNVGAGANTDGSGKYELLATVTGATSDQVGVPPGKYKVTVFEPVLTIEGEGDENMEAMLIPGESTSVIPQRYQAVETTDLVVTVPEAGGTIDIKLEKDSTSQSSAAPEGN